MTADEHEERIADVDAFFRAQCDRLSAFTCSSAIARAIFDECNLGRSLVSAYVDADFYGEPREPIATGDPPLDRMCERAIRLLDADWERSSAVEDRVCR